MTPAEVDRLTEQVLQAHTLVGPRPGQCWCGHGDENLSVSELGKPHARHVVRELRAAGVLRSE